jgi:SulP family sulfate permease
VTSVFPTTPARLSRLEWARELGGGFGDIGLLLPLAIVLITRNHLNATALFAGAGLFYIVTALVYRLPVPVQPLKAVSAIAIAAGLGPAGIVAAGLEMGAIFVLLSVTGLATMLQRVFTQPIVRGIQLSIGMLLAKAAVDLIGKKGQLHAGGAELTMLVGLAAVIALVIFQKREVPGGSLILLALGVVLGVTLGNHPATSLALGPEPLSIVVPNAGDFITAFWILTLPQVGLSIGNSLMATSSAARTYFGDAGNRVTPRRLALTMGLANLVVSPFAGMPMCHGAGGMTAHYRMGARTALATASYGAILLLAALLFGASIVTVASLLPLALLGGFLLYVGIQHAALVSDLRSTDEFVVAGTVAAVSIGTGNISAGVVAGLIVSLVLRN